MVKSNKGSVVETRRTNLRKLIEQHDGPNALARRLGYRNAAFLVTMAGPHPTRDVTEKTARAFEDALKLPANWMDTPGADVATSEGVPVAATPSNTELIQDVIRAVAEHLDEIGVKLQPAKFADVVMLVYADAVEGNGAARADLIRRAVQLAK